MSQQARCCRSSTAFYQESRSGPHAPGAADIPLENGRAISDRQGVFPTSMEQRLVCNILAYVAGKPSVPSSILGSLSDLLLYQAFSLAVSLLLIACVQCGGSKCQVAQPERPKMLKDVCISCHPRMQTLVSPGYPT